MNQMGFAKCICIQYYFPGLLKSSFFQSCSTLFCDETALSELNTFSFYVFQSEKDRIDNGKVSRSFETKGNHFMVYNQGNY